jgi:hypothetical protein
MQEPAAASIIGFHLCHQYAALLGRQHAVEFREVLCGRLQDRFNGRFFCLEQAGQLLGRKALLAQHFHQTGF